MNAQEQQAVNLLREAFRKETLHWQFLLSSDDGSSYSVTIDKWESEPKMHRVFTGDDPLLVAAKAMSVYIADGT